MQSSLDKFIDEYNFESTAQIKFDEKYIIEVLEKIYRETSSEKDSYFRIADFIALLFKKNFNIDPSLEFIKDFYYMIKNFIDAENVLFLTLENSEFRVYGPLHDLDRNTNHLSLKYIIKCKFSIFNIKD